MNLNRIFIIICEGEKSEPAYIEELNKYFREQNINISLVSKRVGTGHFPVVAKTYRNEFQKNRKGKFYIWVDADLYKRNDLKSADKYNKKLKTIPDFCFNFLNFEDFLILHCSKEIVLQYQKLCENKKHFNIPLHADVYMPLIKQIPAFNDYEKKSLPNNFEISTATLENLFRNNADKDIKFKSDFADTIKNFISKS
jgi:hypothetical protein